MNPGVLKVAVVGHTNTGKTSLMRTLTRDVNFGNVSPHPATTRHVEGTSLLVRGRPMIEFYDTPGLEDSISLLDYLDSLRTDRRPDDVEIINRFLHDSEGSGNGGAQSGGRFAQEAKALRQVMAGDVALYVIDARDRVLGKHRDELEILSRCARPIVPVLNFVASPEAQTALWREHLSRANMHAVAEFDTVVLDEHGEQRLFEKIATLVDRHRPTLDALIRERRSERDRLIRASAELVADMLIDAASFVVMAPLDDQAKSEAATEKLKERIRQREQKCVSELLELHRFRADDAMNIELPLVDGRWGVDLFSPAAMKQFGVRTGSAAAAGAMIGFGIDVMTGGMSLGAASALGAAIGAVAGAAQTHARRFMDQVRGHSELRCDDRTLKLLLLRQIHLVRALLRRGHASLDPIRLANSHDPAHAPDFRRLPDELAQARLKRQWSRLGDSASHWITSAGRQAAQDRLAKQIEDTMRSQAGG